MPHATPLRAPKVSHDRGIIDLATTGRLPVDLRVTVLVFFVHCGGAQRHRDLYSRPGCQQSSASELSEGRVARRSVQARAEIRTGYVLGWGVGASGLGRSCRRVISSQCVGHGFHHGFVYSRASETRDIRVSALRYSVAAPPSRAPEIEITAAQIP